MTSRCIGPHLPSSSDEKPPRGPRDCAVPALQTFQACRRSRSNSSLSRAHRSAGVCAPSFSSDRAVIGCVKRAAVHHPSGIAMKRIASAGLQPHQHISFLAAVFGVGKSAANIPQVCDLVAANALMPAVAAGLSGCGSSMIAPAACFSPRLSTMACVMQRARRAHGSRRPPWIAATRVGAYERIKSARFSYCVMISATLRSFGFTMSSFFCTIAKS